jgi:Na+-driven multidrug efflux pump
MPALTASPVIIFRRRLAVLAIAALGLAAAFAPGAASSRQTLMHAFMAKDGTTVVSGYSGGAAIAQSKP